MTGFFQFEEYQSLYVDGLELLLINYDKLTMIPIDPGAYTFTSVFNVPLNTFDLLVSEVSCFTRIAEYSTMCHTLLWRARRWSCLALRLPSQTEC
jgi:hypothetical protein